MPSPPFAGQRGAAALVRASSILGVLISSSLATVAAVAQTLPAPGPEGSVSLDLDIIAQQLDIARNQIQPSLGASVYELRRQAIEEQPQGDNAPLNQVLLQAPGVAQDSFGQLHIRGEHANLQYRLNGVQLPEGINIFGQALETRLANSIALITGALPAQYGFRTAGIIDIQTKTGSLDPGGSVSLYGGQHGWMQPSLEYGGRVGLLDYFITGETLRDTIGIENPTSSYHPIHDLTDQGRGFVYLSGIIDPTARVTAIVGTSHSQFQIPNTRTASSRSPTARASRRGSASSPAVSAISTPRRSTKTSGRSPITASSRCRKSSARSIYRCRPSTVTAASISRPTRSATCCSTALRRPPIAAAWRMAPRATAAIS